MQTFACKQHQWFSETEECQECNKVQLPSDVVVFRAMKARAKQLASEVTDSRATHLHDCAVSGEIPQEIRSLIGRCEINETTFSNDDMSLALKFGELVWGRLVMMAEHYERQADNLMDHRGPIVLQAAKDMRFVLSDTARDL